MGFACPAAGSGDSPPWPLHRCEQGIWPCIHARNQSGPVETPSGCTGLWFSKLSTFLIHAVTKNAMPSCGHSLTAPMKSELSAWPSETSFFKTSENIVKINCGEQESNLYFPSGTFLRTFWPNRCCRLVLRHISVALTPEKCLGPWLAADGQRNCSRNSLKTLIHVAKMGSFTRLLLVGRCSENRFPSTSVKPSSERVLFLRT